MRSVLSDLGINPGKALPAPPPPAAVGGPFVPANFGSEEKSFERQLYRIHLIALAGRQAHPHACSTCRCASR